MNSITINTTNTSNSSFSIIKLTQTWNTVWYLFLTTLAVRMRLLSNNILKCFGGNDLNEKNNLIQCVDWLQMNLIFSYILNSRHLFSFSAVFNSNQQRIESIGLWQFRAKTPTMNIKEAWFKYKWSAHKKWHIIIQIYLPY